MHVGHVFVYRAALGFPLPPAAERPVSFFGSAALVAQAFVGAPVLGAG